MLDAAKREFEEEIGTSIEFDKHIVLKPVLQTNNKIVHAFAVEINVDISNFKSNNFTLEYPKNSGIILEFPELDKAAWVNAATAKLKLSRAQSAFVDDLINKLK